MQRSRRRPLCSTASASSQSSTTLRSLRRRSRTPSAGGDFFAVSETDEEPRCDEDNANNKSKPRSTKYNMRMLNNSVKNSRKNRKAGKPNRSTINSLQNTIVLAPFNALKKCFQNKLVDLYSQEKMKKMNQKMRLAMKPNKAFEYDVIELKTPSGNIKKEKKPSSEQQTDGTQKEKDGKDKRNARSESYCQCDKKGYQTNTAATGINESNTRKLRRSRESSPFNYKNSPLACNSKRRKLGNDHFTPMILKADRAAKSIANICLGRRSNRSNSATSSHSKNDSWETFNDLPSYREEHLEGILSLSTTSFDSFLEQGGKDGSNLFENQIISCASRHNTPLLILGERGKSKSKEKIENSQVLSKPRTGESRHLILNVGSKYSDGQIGDFTDREPQTQMISPMEGTQILPPLRRQKKSKEGKINESETSKAYYLRSTSLNKEDNFITDNFISGGQPVNASNTRVCIDGEKYGIEEEEVSDRVEVGIQVENNPEQRVVTNIRTPNREKSCIGKTNKTPDSPPLTSFPSEIPDNSSKPDSKSAGGSDFTPEKTSEFIKKSLSKPKMNPEMTEEVSLPHVADTVTVNDKSTEKKKEETTADENGKKEESKISEADLFEDSMEAFLDPLEPPQQGHSPQGILPDLGSRFTEPSQSLNIIGEAQGLQEKESDFIFGPRNASSRLGESCEFSFGLNFVFSDEEDSDHGDFF